MALFEVKNISKSFGGPEATRDFSLEAEAGEIHGIIGPSGAGKTTIFNVISGVYTADEGSVTLKGRDVTKMGQYLITREGMGCTFQNIRLFKGLTVSENVLCALDPRSKYGVVGGLLPTPKRFSEEKRGREVCGQYLELVGMADYKNERPENLAYGKQRHAEITRALTCHPKVLLLDEPAAGLNPTEVSELTDLVQRLSADIGFAILLIEHRLELVMSILHKIHVQSFGKTIAVGTPDEVRQNPEAIEAYLGEEEQAMVTLEVVDLNVDYGHAKVLKHVSVKVNEGEIVSIIGSSGVGKTTLLCTISGLKKPQGGKVHFLGETLPSQPHKIVAKRIVYVPGGRKIFSGLTIRDNPLVGGYLFKGKELENDLQEQYCLLPILRERQNQFVGALSGGEQQMFAISRGLMARPKIILLNEPSLGLAPLIVNQVYDLIKKIRDSGITVLLVEQNARKVLSICDKAYVLENGMINISGIGDELLHSDTVCKAYLGG